MAVTDHRTAERVDGEVIDRREGPTKGSAADNLRPVLRAVLGTDQLPVGVRCWDGSRLGPATAPATIVVRSPDALRRMLLAPGELGLARAYVAGDLDIDGDFDALLGLRAQLAARRERADVRLGWRGWRDVAAAAVRVGAVGPPLPPPPEEARLGGRLHSRRRDSDAIAHHYDLGNDFYALVLGPSMTYSCAYFERDGMTLEDAQAAKHELVCRKLGLEPGMRLLDVGCGWGGMVLHAAQHHGVHAVGITLSPLQAEMARARVVAAGLEGRVEIRIQDDRDVDDGPYDAISSIGMFEHVGRARASAYLGHLHALLRPQGRLLNHAISSPTTPGPPDRRSFLLRYIFPDGELMEVGATVTAAQDVGFEVRDVHSLREHYGQTLRCWAANLDAAWDDAVRLVGARRARAWRLYLVACARNFEEGRTTIHQVLAVKDDEHGVSGVPRTRASYA